MADAIDRGLKANLGLLTSQQSSEEVRAQRSRALSGLLPKVSGQFSMTEQQLNLQALGFNLKFPPSAGFPIPTIVPPYSYQSALLNVTAPFLDYSAISNFRASRESQKAASLSLKNARDLVVQAVGNAYLQIIADGARITATQAEIDADNAVYTNAVRRHDAGTAIGIDVLRSQVELKQRQQQLVAVNNQFEKDKLTLGTNHRPSHRTRISSRHDPARFCAARSRVAERRAGQSIRAPAGLSSREGRVLPRPNSPCGR